MAQEYLIGVMITPVENPDEAFRAVISTSIAAMGVLVGSLGERVDNRNEMRWILFV